MTKKGDDYQVDVKTENDATFRQVRIFRLHGRPFPERTVEEMKYIQLGVYVAAPIAGGLKAEFVDTSITELKEESPSR